MAQPDRDEWIRAKSQWNKDYDRLSREHPHECAVYDKDGNLLDVDKRPEVDRKFAGRPIFIGYLGRGNPA